MTQSSRLRSSISTRPCMKAESATDLMRPFRALIAQKDGLVLRSNARLVNDDDFGICLTIKKKHSWGYTGQSDPHSEMTQLYPNAAHLCLISHAPAAAPRSVIMGKSESFAHVHGASPRTTSQHVWPIWSLLDKHIYIIWSFAASLSTNCVNRDDERERCIVYQEFPAI